MNVLIDADGCPVVDTAIVCCRVYPSVQVIILCDTSHMIEREGVRTITVSKGADSVDFALVNLIHAGDLVITQDYGLAAMCLAKRARVFRQDGLEYTNDNIDALLQVRYENKKVRLAGGRIKGPARRSRNDDDKFVAVFSKALEEV